MCGDLRIAERLSRCQDTVKLRITSEQHPRIAIRLMNGNDVLWTFNFKILQRHEKMPWARVDPRLVDKEADKAEAEVATLSDQSGRAITGAMVV